MIRGFKMNLYGGYYGDKSGQQPVSVDLVNVFHLD